MVRLLTMEQDTVIRGTSYGETLRKKYDDATSSKMLFDVLRRVRFLKGIRQDIHIKEAAASPLPLTKSTGPYCIRMCFG